jgi:2-polyprenyl-6-methoxyphenol hydroxylase-like FAD-dependent oxidoreductase
MSEATDVLVVGAGPTGLTLACELLRHGLRVRIVDEADGPTEFSKAIAVHARTLEVLRSMGCVDALLARGQKLHGATMWSGGAAVVRADFDELETAYPFILSTPQRDTEAVLGDLLKTRGGAVERSTRLTGFKQDGTGVTATLVKGGVTETARAAWLVGCDGARSVVRKALDMPFEGSTYEDRFLLADVRIAWDARDDRIAAYFADDGLVACFPLPEKRWRLIATAGASDDRADAPTLDEVQAVFARRTGTGATLSDLAWSSRFRIHCRQVASYRDDRVMLAGDAAHIHSPAGGQGMNTGIQDAHNLAWKLAEVHKGDARMRLLESYHDERHAVGQAVLRGTDVATRVGLLKGAVVKGVRDELARFLTGIEVVQQRVSREVAELSVGYERSAIVREDHTSVLQARIGLAASAETPTVTSVRWFDSAIAAGQRAKNGRVTVAGESGTRDLLDLVDTRRWSVLLFDGRSASAEGYQRFAAIASDLAARYPDAVATFVVTPRAQRPAELPDAIPVLLDPDGELERVYGAVTECVYVLRPDLYVGYRAQPADATRLLAYFHGILRASAS